MHMLKALRALLHRFAVDSPVSRYLRWGYASLNRRWTEILLSSLSISLPQTISYTLWRSAFRPSGATPDETQNTMAALLLPNIGSTCVNTVPTFTSRDLVILTSERCTNVAIRIICCHTAFRYFMRGIWVVCSQDLTRNMSHSSRCIISPTPITAKISKTSASLSLAEFPAEGDGGDHKVSKFNAHWHSVCTNTWSFLSKWFKVHFW